MWAEELPGGDIGREVTETEQMLALHNDSATHMHNHSYQVMQSGQDLLQVRHAVFGSSLCRLDSKYRTGIYFLFVSNELITF